MKYQNIRKLNTSIKLNKRITAMIDPVINAVPLAIN